ncbi:hypothetical protein D3C75_548600 [compost metagenome]
MLALREGEQIRLVTAHLVEAIAALVLEGDLFHLFKGNFAVDGQLAGRVNAANETLLRFEGQVVQPVFLDLEFPLDPLARQTPVVAANGVNTHLGSAVGVDSGAGALALGIESRRGFGSGLLRFNHDGLTARFLHPIRLRLLEHFLVRQRRIFLVQLDLGENHRLARRDERQSMLPL